MNERKLYPVSIRCNILYIQDTMKKILFITSLSGKRLNYFMMSSILAAKNNELEFHLACNTSNADLIEYKKDCINHNIYLHHIDFQRHPLNPINLRALFQVKKLLTQKFDIIHTNTPIGGLIGRVASIGKTAKVIYTAHGFHFHSKGSLLSWLIYYPIEYVLSYFTDSLVTINQEDYNISKKMKSKRKIFIPGVGFDSSFKSSEDIYISKPTKMNNQPIRIISIGELNKNKNHILSIKAISQLENIEYLICGEGKLRPKLQKLINRLKSSDKIVLLGHRSDVKELLSSSDIFVFPSKREGLSIALMEAMSIGLPCLVSNIRGNRDLIDINGGCLFNSKKELCDHIDLLRNDISLRIKMGEYNKIKIQNFSLDVVVKKYSELYKEMLGGLNEKYSS